MRSMCVIQSQTSKESPENPNPIILAWDLSVQCQTFISGCSPLLGRTLFLLLQPPIPILAQSGPYESYGLENTGVLHGISTRIQWDWSQALKSKMRQQQKVWICFFCWINSELSFISKPTNLTPRTQQSQQFRPPTNQPNEPLVMTHMCIYGKGDTNSLSAYSFR